MACAEKRAANTAGAEVAGLKVNSMSIDAAVPRDKKRTATISHGAGEPDLRLSCRMLRLLTEKLSGNLTDQLKLLTLAAAGLSAHSGPVIEFGHRFRESN